MGIWLQLSVGVRFPAAEERNTAERKVSLHIAAFKLTAGYLFMLTRGLTEAERCLAQRQLTHIKVIISSIHFVFIAFLAKVGRDDPITR